MESGKVKCDIGNDVLPVFVDRDQIKRALMNLIKNSLEAISEGGSVEIKTLTAHRNARVMITDNGPGLSPSAKENLFTPYFTTKPGGSGLGLVIVKKIITEHDGSIKIADIASGGTVVKIDLPIRAAIDKRG